MTLRAGPWIEHDGRGYPLAVVRAEKARGAVLIQRAVSTTSGTRKVTDYEIANPSKADPDHPGWVWSMRGLFVWRRPVCADPLYHPILRYRFHYDQPPAVSAQVEMLRAIAAGTRLPDAEPVPGETVSDAARGGRIPRGSNACFSHGRDAGFHCGGRAALAGSLPRGAASPSGAGCWTRPEGFHPPGERRCRALLANTSPAGAPGIGAGITSLLTSPGALRVGGLFGGASRGKPPCVRGVGAVVTWSSGCTPQEAGGGT